MLIKITGCWARWRRRFGEMRLFSITRFRSGTVILGRSNCYVPISAELGRRKVSLLNEHYSSQRTRDWWDDENSLGYANTRNGMPKPLRRSFSDVEGYSFAGD